MRRLWMPVLTALLCIVGACMAAAAPVTPVVPPSLTATATPAPSVDEPGVDEQGVDEQGVDEQGVDEQAAVAAEVNQATQAVLPNVQVGFEVVDREDDTVLTSQNADRQVAAMSVVKLLIALDALARDTAVGPGGGAMQRDLHQMLANSDDQIANELWTTGGGPAIVTRMVRLLGLTGTQPPDDPGAWGDTRITPQDVVTIYRYITDRLPNADQDLVLGALADPPKIAADGFDQYFGIPDGMRNLSWAVKQGWGTSGSQAVMNSTGLVGPEWRYIVVVLASAPANSYSTLPTAVTAAASALASLVSAVS